jgi:hypothetical protein
LLSIDCLASKSNDGEGCEGCESSTEI